MKTIERMLSEPTRQARLSYREGVDATFKFLRESEIRGRIIEIQKQLFMLKTQNKALEKAILPRLSENWIQKSFTENPNYDASLFKGQTMWCSKCHKLIFRKGFAGAQSACTCGNVLYE